MDEKRIEIIEDIDGKITFDEIERKDINRADVDAAKAEIERIEAENAEFLARIEENKAKVDAIKAKIAYAEKIIAIADEKKAAEEPKVEDAISEEVNPENAEIPQA